MQRKSTQSQENQEYLRLAGVRKRYNGVSSSTIWRWSSDPKSGFPQPIKLSPGETVWPLASLQAWEASRAAQGGVK